MRRSRSRARPAAAACRSGDFITGVRRTALAPGELVVAIHVPRPVHEARSAFLKLGTRRYLVISIAMAAATVEIADGRVAAARIAVGACSPVAERLPALEAALDGRANRSSSCRAGRGLRTWRRSSPIDDVRGSAAYRSDAVVTVLRRLLGRLRAMKVAFTLNG